MVVLWLLPSPSTASAPAPAAVRYLRCSRCVRAICGGRGESLSASAAIYVFGTLIRSFAQVPPGAFLDYTFHVCVGPDATEEECVSISSTQVERLLESLPANRGIYIGLSTVDGVEARHCYYRAFPSVFGRRWILVSGLRNRLITCRCEYWSVKNSRPRSFNANEGGAHGGCTPSPKNTGVIYAFECLGGEETLSLNENRFANNPTPAPVFV